MKELSPQEQADYIFLKLQEKADSKNSLMGWFRQWDYHKRGRLSKDEFRTGIAAFHFNISEEVLDLVVKRFDLDINSSITFHEFASALRPQEGQKDQAASSFASKKPVRSVVEKVLIKLWRLLPEDKDPLIGLLETYDEDGTGLMRKIDFRRVMNGLNIIKVANIDIIIDSDVFSAGSLFNYRAFLQEASRLGCQEQSIDEGRSPRMRVPYNHFKDTIVHDREMVRRESQAELLSPRYIPRGRNEYSEHQNPFFRGKGVKDQILGPNDDSLQYANEKTRFSKTTPYLPTAMERWEHKDKRDNAVFTRINNNEQRVFNVNVEEAIHKEREHQGTLGLYRKQRKWYNENVALQARMNRDINEQGIKVNRGRGPPHFGVHDSGGYQHS